MSFTHAGFFIEALQDDRGNALKITAFTLTNPAAGNATVPTYTDATKTTLHSGSLYTDAYGNASFYAEPGVYTLTVPSTGRSFLVQVQVAAADINTTVDSSVMHLTGTETVTGPKNFTGGLSKGGAEVATEAEASAAAASAVAPMRHRFNAIATPKTASYSAAVWDSATYDVSGGSISQALPSSPAVGDEWEAFVSYAATANTLTVTGTGGPFTLYPGHGVVMRWNGSAWVERQDRKSVTSNDDRYRTGVSARSFGVKIDGKRVFSGSIASGSNVLGASGAGFTATDVGKIISVGGAGASGANLLTTIAGYTSATQVTLATNASMTVSTAAVSWGTDARQLSRLSSPTASSTISAASPTPASAACHRRSTSQIDRIGRLSAKVV